MFHSVHWDQSAALAGQRIAVVGTGSTGVQLVAALGGVASRLLHFQRTPQWIFPDAEHALLRVSRGGCCDGSPCSNRMSFRFWLKLHRHVHRRG